MTSPQPYKELPQLLARQLTALEQPLLEGFLTTVLPEITTTVAEGHGDCWCDPAGLLEIFRFLHSPPQAQTRPIQVRLSRQQGGGDGNMPEGTRLLVNLPDTPFILDAVRSFLQQSGLALYALAHTVLFTTRDESGQLLSIAGQQRNVDQREMLLVALVEPIADEHRLQMMEENVRAILGAVKRSVEDFPAMNHFINDEATVLATLGMSEESRFLRWLLEDNFVFMGLRTMKELNGVLHVPPRGVHLGIFNCPQAEEVCERLMPGLLQEVSEILTASRGEGLTIDYCRHGRSIIYASEGVDFFAVKHPDGHDGMRNILLVFGRFSRTALANRASLVPILAGRSARILALSGFDRQSSAHYEFRSLYDRMPLRELFYSDPPVIAAQIREILRLQGDTDVKVMARAGRHGHYGAILCAFSHNRYRSGLKEMVSQAISRHMGRAVAAVTTAGTNTRMFVVCYVDHEPHTPFVADTAAMADTVKALICTWLDRLHTALIHRMPPATAQRLLARHGAFLDALYQEATPPEEAVDDLAILETFLKGKTFACRISPVATGGYHLRLYGQHPFPLAPMIRTLDHCGIVCLHEFSCSLTLGSSGTVWISRYEIDLPAARGENLQETSHLLEQLLTAMERQQLADDPLNRLALLAGLSPRSLWILTGLRQYLLQLLPHLAVTAINRALLGHPEAARLLVEGFTHHLSPTMGHPPPWQENFEAALNRVTSLVDDQILRSLRQLIQASLRTNALQTPQPEALAIKIDPALMDGLALPRPWREIFVYAPGLEGIHLRGGAVARGGIRHSDRLDDYRAEVLGLMQTQRIKNAIIVPEGAKGGFVLTNWEQIPMEHRKKETIHRYKQYIRALLSITDNRVAEADTPYALDGPDPYLVVAADKGTASFSDLANELSLAAGFWLGDAFASGGSRGFNHKELGITARGAWECISLHFQELNHPLAEAGITVVAIGDMAGDVFGNGLLACRTLRLVGAFNHLHIFLDPNPDPSLSFAERQRLFELPSSTWADYRPEVISEGGGVFLRNAKSIALGEPLRQLLGTSQRKLSGEAIIRLLLCAPVDLLYNGGIGTYIKAQGESHAQVGDKSNDSVRVDAHQVRARVIAEGGNLGITRQGRLEFARPWGERPGGRINTDAVDNSGGVDLSDHEVNYKIFLNLLTEQGRLEPTERHSLLADLKQEATLSVLADNRGQHLAISRDQLRSQRQGEGYLELLDYLIDSAGLNPTVEAIPPREQLTTWILAGEGLPRPLLATMLGYAKIHIKQTLLTSELVDNPYGTRILRDYFPPSLMARYGHQVDGHFLRREIVAAGLANRILNQTGLGLFFGFLLPHGHTGTTIHDFIPHLISGYLVADTWLHGADYRQQTTLAPLPMAAWHQSQDRLEEVLLHVANQLAADGWAVLEESFLSSWQGAVAQLDQDFHDHLPTLLSPERLAILDLDRQHWLDLGMPSSLASRACWLPLHKEIASMAHLCREINEPLPRLTMLQLRLADHFGLDWLDECLSRVRNRDLWGSLTVADTRRQLARCRVRLVRSVAALAPHAPQAACDAFIQKLGEANTTYLSLLTQAQHLEHTDLLPLTVLVQRLREFLSH